jgi:hypothetical protein
VRRTPRGADKERGLRAARCCPGADVRFLDTGHFALETHVDEIATAIGEFLSR